MSSQSNRAGIALFLEYPLADRGGVSVLVEELILAFGEEFAVWLISPDSSEDVLKSPVGHLLEGHVRFVLTHLPPSGRYDELASSLVEKLKEAGIKLVHFHCGGTFGWGNRWPGRSMPRAFSRAGLKTVWTNHLTEPAAKAFAARGRSKRLSGALGPVGRLGKILQTRAVDTEIAVSEHDRDYLQAHYPAGRALKRIYHSRLRESILASTSIREPLILAVGHIAFRKGQHFLVRAFLEIAASVPDWRLEIAGHDGGDGCWQEIQSLCASHPQGSRVNLLGAHSRPSDLMSRASIFVQPSLEEALGLAVQEAIFLGCPAIGTRVGGIPEVIDEGITGLLVEPGSAEAIAAALTRLISDSGLRQEFGARGREAILRKGMTAPRMADAHRSLYLELLA
ncbi:glycosyltransferase family 4 protein [Luteolibacter luteus]|uniref:Glycosyltransferase family 4 protein n=1 Tax=Luteolibacter luteus TaxID=2728835 RepID=A0A858RLU5_9BACT|nr:glycosyltransferase family 4 protein [Luteolibacter luteus]QJE96963.1 glycosyltransferase family 4 protein [Luteolibacter luteus]